MKTKVSNVLCSAAILVALALFLSGNVWTALVACSLPTIVLGFWLMFPAYKRAYGRMLMKATARLERYVKSLARE